MWYLISLVLALSAFLFQNTEGYYVLMILSVAMLIVSIISQICRYWMQSDNIEEIEEMKADREVYKRQCNDLLSEIKIYLIDKFPEHELKVFDKITKNTAQFLAVDYPELKSDETFKKAVDNIVSGKNRIYDIERRMNGKIREIKARKKTIWLTGFPILPDSKGIDYGLEQEDISK